jgi:tetratricopeptide (TPR) repeat protein
MRVFKLSKPLLIFVSLCSINIALAHADELESIAHMASDGTPSLAMEKLNTYMTSHPNDLQGQLLKGILLNQQGKTYEAIKIFNALATHHPELPAASNNLAVIYASQKQYDQAIKVLENLIKHDPQYLTAYKNLGDAYAEMAANAYDKAYVIDGTDTQTKNKIAALKTLLNIQNPNFEKPKNQLTTPSSTSASASTSNDDNTLITNTLNAWLQAWSDKNVDQYLSFYADTFKTPNGASRALWQQTRKERIQRPSAIKVEAIDPQIKISGDSATVTFKQRYAADGKTVFDTKRLNLKKSGDQWRIEQELSGLQ